MCQFRGICWIENIVFWSYSLHDVLQKYKKGSVGVGYGLRANKSKNSYKNSYKNNNRSNNTNSNNNNKNNNNNNTNDNNNNNSNHDDDNKIIIVIKEPFGK